MNSEAKSMSDLQPFSALWDSIAGRRVEVVRYFYDQLFETHPEYKRLFPEQMDHQMEKMVEMISAVARFSNRIDLIQPYLMQISRTHQTYNLSSQDLNNFKRVFIDAIAASLPEQWNKQTEDSLNCAFDDTLIPIFEEGLQA